jgi:hypothetical protein
MIQRARARAVAHHKCLPPPWQQRRSDSMSCSSASAATHVAWLPVDNPNVNGQPALARPAPSQCKAIKHLAVSCLPSLLPFAVFQNSPASETWELASQPSWSCLNPSKVQILTSRGPCPPWPPELSSAMVASPLSIFAFDVAFLLQRYPFDMNLVQFGQPSRRPSHSR